MEAKIISRGAGRSACAAAAYMSCSRIYNDYDGVQHDYTRKQGLVWERVFLPSMAPQEWQDREKLWNAIEEQEKTKDSRLAREFVAALPVELDKEVWAKLLSEFIQKNFVEDGMCADVAIHDTDGHNPHAHIMLTVRTLTGKGTWQHKTEKEYLCVRDGEEQGFTAAEFKAAQAEGWKKQYPYKVGKKKIYMTAAEAEDHGYERVSKYPKCTKFGRQNSISARWNSEEQLVAWRAAWADTVNRYLERAGREERIDHRSHAEREIDEQPTVHEGVAAQSIENRGMVSDRVELNRQIKADNKFLRELKAQVKKLTETAKNSIPVIAETLESLRNKMLIFCYQLLYIRSGEGSLRSNISAIKAQRNLFIALMRKIQDTGKSRKALIEEQKNTPKIQIFRHRDLSCHIAELTEELEELRSEKTQLLRRMAYADNAGPAAFDQDISAMETQLDWLKQREQKYSTELDSALKEYAELKKQAATLDPVELYRERYAIRDDKKKDASRRLKKAYGDKYAPIIMFDSEHRVSRLLNEDAEEQAALKELRRRQQIQQPRHKSRNRDYER